MRKALVLFATLALACAGAAEKPFLEKEDIFPLDAKHNHASSLVRLPDGGLMVCWYRGSGERTADDVQIMGAVKPRGAKTWSKPFVLADEPGYPDTNPVLFVDRQGRLWLFWQTILANLWESAVTNFRMAEKYGGQGVPRWDRAGLVLPKPAGIEEAAAELLRRAQGTVWEKQAARIAEMAKDKLTSRLGWMTRAHPLQLPSGRILLPMYSDGFDFSLVAISDDGGLTWRGSRPIVSVAGIQPTFARKKDGTLVAYMRDNGPPPKRLQVSYSKDDGETWSPAEDTDIPNSGTGVEVIQLQDGRWLMINNDTEKGRHSLALTISDDEGATWKWKRHIELDTRAERAGSFHYPSILQAPDGTLHASYSVFLNHLPEGQPRKTIRYARFNVAWVEAGDPQ
jgi:predicted neuraminidase